MSGTTTVITTHYVEEARQSSTVGIMRNGRLLTQDEPGTIMNRFQALSLESAFLHLCEQDLQDNRFILVLENTLVMIF